MAKNNNIQITKIQDNEFRIFDPLFKTSNRRDIMPVINWLCSMNILNDVPNDNKPHDLIEHLKSIRNKYNNYSLKQIDRVINFE